MGQAAFILTKKSKHTQSWYKVWGTGTKFVPTIWLKSQGEMMVIYNEFQSWPCPTVYHTYNETLEGSSCCKINESGQTHSILVWQVRMGQAKFVPTCDSKTGCGDHLRHLIPISALSNHSLYQWWDIGWVKLLSIAWSNLNTLNLGTKYEDVEPNLSLPYDSKVRVKWWLYICN